MLFRSINKIIITFIFQDEANNIDDDDMDSFFTVKKKTKEEKEQEEEDYKTFLLENMAEVYI